MEHGACHATTKEKSVGHAAKVGSSFKTIFKDLFFGFWVLVKYCFYGAWREKLRPSHYLWVEDGSKKTKEKTKKVFTEINKKSHKE